MWNLAGDSEHLILLLFELALLPLLLLAERFMVVLLNLRCGVWDSGLRAERGNFRSRDEK